MPPHGRLPSNSCIGRAPHDFPNLPAPYLWAHRIQLAFIGTNREQRTGYLPIADSLQRVTQAPVSEKPISGLIRFSREYAIEQYNGYPLTNIMIED